MTGDFQKIYLLQNQKKFDSLFIRADRSDEEKHCG